MTKKNTMIECPKCHCSKVVEITDEIDSKYFNNKIDIAYRCLGKVYSKKFKDELIDCTTEFFLFKTKIVPRQIIINESEFSPFL